jgi:hypothetical protein
MTVNIHRVSSGRDCRETVASLRNARATRYHQANFLWLGRQRLLRRQHYAVSPVTSKSRCAKCQRQSRDCTSDRPAAPATESISFSHAVTLIPLQMFRKLIPRSTSHFWASPLPPASARNAFSPSRGNVPVECCSDALLLLRYGCLRPRRACHRSQQRIPTLNLAPAIALH